MFAQQTLFILGAGASDEYGFPQGTALVKNIQYLMSLTYDGLQMQGAGRPLILQAAKERGIDANALIEAASRMRLGLAHFKSIDDFLHQRQGDNDVIDLGKRAIAEIILNCEQESPLAKVSARHSLGDAGLGDSWLSKFIKMLIAGRRLADRESIFQNVEFITFNYDRSLQEFLIWAIYEAWSVPVEEALSIVAKVPIHHVYGSLGGLPGFGKKLTTPYGAKLRLELIGPVSEGIRTYTESVSDDSDIVEVKKAISKARKLVFLGFGFHKQNMEILSPVDAPKDCEIVGTIFQAKQTSRETITRRIKSLFDGKAHSPINDVYQGLHDVKCTGFFDEFALALTD
jgi:hypothetical protein